MAVANNQDTLRETQQLNQALEETRWKMSQLGSDTVRVQNDVSNAMSRVTGQLRQLGNTMVPVANVGLNLFSRLLRVLQPLAEHPIRAAAVGDGAVAEQGVQRLEQDGQERQIGGESHQGAGQGTERSDEL